MRKIFLVKNSEDTSMPKPILFALVAIILILFARSVHAQMLWGGTVYGMSTQEVLKVVPNAKMMDRGHYLQGGAKELIRADNIYIVNKKFYASFFFIKNKLEQVTLTLDKISFNDALLTFESLTEALRGKYGVELKREIDKISVLKQASATWMSGKTNINVLAITVGDNPAILNINYQIRLSKESDKL